MADPWSILGLRSDTADEKQVRTAYARLLKVHRPDQDPEGFQQLRTAYEQALEWLRFRTLSDEDEEPDDVVKVELEPDVVLPVVSDSIHVLPSSWAAGEVPVLPYKLGQTPHPEQRKQQRPERNWPREWSYSLESLDRALLGETRHLDVIAVALRALAVDVAECGIPAFALECILSDAFDTDAGLFGMTVPVAILSQLLQGGCIAFLKRAVNALEQAGDPARITQMAQKLDDCLAEASSPRTAEVYFRVAGLAALHKPFVAQSILRKLKGFLDASAYSAKFDSLHTAITHGMALRDLAQDYRLFWAQRLEHPEAVCDWKAETSAHALMNVVVLGPQWAGCPLVQGVVPADVWRDAWKYRWVQVSVFRLIRMLKPRNLMVAGLALIGGGFLIFGAHLVTQVTPSRRPDPATQTEEFKRNYELGQKRFKDYINKKKQLQQAHPDTK